MRENSSTNIAVALDVKKPGTFLSDYEYLLRKAKPNSKRAMVAATRRLMNALDMAKSNLLMASQKKVSCISEWLSKKREIKSIKAQVESCKAALASWVNNTLSFFFHGAKWNVL